MWHQIPIWCHICTVRLREALLSRYVQPFAFTNHQNVFQINHAQSMNKLLPVAVWYGIVVFDVPLDTV